MSIDYSKHKMPAAIPDKTKSEVINQWLRGFSRDAIASNTHVSAGAVTNIINEWKNYLGQYDVESLRELGRMLKIADISPSQCALGFRTIKILTERGIDTDSAQHFVSDIFRGCERMGVTPDKISTHIEDLLSISDRIRLPEIEDYLDKKRNEKRQLDKQSMELSERKSILESEILRAIKSRDSIYEQERKLSGQLKISHDTEEELRKYDISMTEDIPKFLKIVKVIKAHGYEPKKVIGVFEGVQYAEDKLLALKIAANEKEKDLTKLDKQRSSLQNTIYSDSEYLILYDELNSMGIGSDELRTLITLISDIAKSNGMDYWNAIERFFSEIGFQYDSKLGFESEKKKLIKDIQKLREQRDKLQQIINAQPFFGPVLLQLSQYGLTEDDIVNIILAYLRILNGKFRLEDLTKGMEKIIDMVSASSKTQEEISEEKLEALDKVREGLSYLNCNV
jgi:hypothetical protein